MDKENPLTFYHIVALILALVFSGLMLYGTLCLDSVVVIISGIGVVLSILVYGVVDIERRKNKGYK